MYCRKWNRKLITSPILMVPVFFKMETFFYSQAHYRKIIHCPLVSTVLLYSLVHSSLCLSKKLIGILLHLDVPMEQNTFQLLRQMETTVYQWVHNYSQLARQQATTVYKWVHNHSLIKGWGVSINTIFSTGILPLGRLLQQNITAAAVLIHIHFPSHYHPIT